MVKGTKVTVNVKTGQRIEEEVDITPMPMEPEAPKVDIKDLVKLVAYAKAQGWI